MTTLDMYPDYKKKKSGSATLDREGKICENLCVKVIFKFDFRYKLFKIQTLFQARKREKNNNTEARRRKSKMFLSAGLRIRNFKSSNSDPVFNSANQDSSEN